MKFQSSLTIMRTLIYLLFFVLAGFTKVYSQYTHHHQKSDSSANPGEHHLQKTEKGPNHGKIVLSNGVKVEMVTPSGKKKTEVMYYVYDSLSKPVDAKLYTGSVKYIFGNANQYLQVKLVPSGESNQYIATLEGWNEYKKAVVVLKANDKTYTFSFYNDVVPTQNQAGNSTGNGNQGGHHHGGHGGGMGGGGMGGGGMNGGGMGGGGMNGGGINGRGF